MLADFAVKSQGVCVYVCVCVCVWAGGGAGWRETESSSEKLQKMISADVRVDVKQQEIKRTSSNIL